MNIQFEAYRAKVDEYKSLQDSLSILQGDALTIAKKRMFTLANELRDLKTQLNITDADIRQMQRKPYKRKPGDVLIKYTPEFIQYRIDMYRPLWPHKILRPRMLQQYHRILGVRNGLAKSREDFEARYKVGLPGCKGNITDYLWQFDRMEDVPVNIRSKADGKIVWTNIGEDNADRR